VNSISGGSVPPPGCATGHMYGRVGWTNEAREVVVEPVDECESLQRAEQLVVVQLARVRLHELVQTVLASLVRICTDTSRPLTYRAGFKGWGKLGNCPGASTTKVKFYLNNTVNLHPLTP